MRIAAIDIGTNSIHMIIARVHPRGRYEIVDSQKEMVKLGRGGLTEGVLMQDAQDRAIAAHSVQHGCSKETLTDNSAARDTLLRYAA